jgi:hypothetical protein
LGKPSVSFTPINLYRGIIQNDPKIFEVRAEISDVEAKIFNRTLICSSSSWNYIQKKGCKLRNTCLLQLM